MSETVYFAVSGIGLGHAGRSIKIAERLQSKGLNVYFSSYGEAVKYISKKFKCFSVYEMRLGWRNIGGLSLRETSKFLLKSSLPRFIKQVILESKIIEKINPSVIYSDSRGSAILAAKLKFKPVISITNQLSVYLPEQETGKYFIKLANALSPIILPKLWSLSDLVCIADLPPPYSISKRNIMMKSKVRRMIFVGLIGEELAVSDSFKKEVCAFFKEKTKPLVYVSATGPREERRLFISKFLRILPELKQYNFIFTLGNPDGSINPIVQENLVLYEWFPSREKLIAISDIVISRAGRSTIDTCILNEKPMITVPSIRQTEQEENARRIHELEAGRCIYDDELSLETLRRNINLIMDNYSKYAKKLRFLHNLSLRLGGIDRIISYLKKMMISN